MPDNFYLAANKNIMTYCLAIKVKEGLIAIADTRVSVGSSISVQKKIFISQKGKNSLFVMASGLRSTRDKTMEGSMTF